MTVTITSTGHVATVDADQDTWGDKVNADAERNRADLQALADQGNALEALDPLSKAGGTMTGALALHEGAPSGPFDAGYRGAPLVAVSASKTLTASDAGKAQRPEGGTALTLTIPPNVLAVNAIVPVRNVSTQPCAIQRGSGVELRIAGSSVNKNCNAAPFCMATLYQEALNVWVLSGVGVS